MHLVGYNLIMDIQEVFIREGEDILVQRFPVVGDWNDITKDGKPLKKSIIQKDLRRLLEVSDVSNVLWTRRGGKSTELADNFYDKIIFKGKPMKHKKRYIAAHPKSQNLYKNFMETWLPLPFGGASELRGDLNNVWIPLPEKYFDIITNPNMTEQEMVWWFGDGKNDKPIIRQHLEKYYVKLFKTPVGANMSKKSAEGLCRGMFFNGGVLELIGANYNFDDYVSGGDIAGFWGEEVGGWDTDYISKVAMPAIISAGGFVQLSWTPNKEDEPKKHWTYKAFVEPIDEAVKQGQYQKIRQHGVDYYTSVVEIPYTVEVDGEEVVKTKKSVNFISLAKFSECFPYAHGGIETFVDVAVNCQEKISAIEKRDEDNNILKDEEGFIQYDIHVDRDILNRTRRIPPIDRAREYEISFAGMHEDRVFYSFGEHNIIKRDDFKPENYNKLTGFDKGVSKIDEVKGTILGTNKQYATYWCDIARTGLNQWVIYEEGLMNFIYEEVGKLFLEKASQGMPTVYDSVMKTEKGRYSRDVVDSDIYQIILAEPKMKPGYANSLYYNCLIPSKKRENAVKIEEFNSMFQEQGETIPSILHPITGLPGAPQFLICDNCPIAIAQFSDWMYKINQDGNKIRAVVREDAWDASSYPIDTFRYDEKKRKQIEMIWRDTRYKNSNFIQTQGLMRKPNGYMVRNYYNPSSSRF